MSGVRKAIKHGTIGGYMAHRRREDAPCGSCTTAWRVYHQERRGALPRRAYLRTKAEAKAKAAVRQRQRQNEYAARRAKRAARRLSNEKEMHDQASAQDPTE